MSTIALALLPRVTASQPQTLTLQPGAPIQSVLDSQSGPLHIQLQPGDYDPFIIRSSSAAQGGYVYIEGLSDPNNPNNRARIKASGDNPDCVRIEGNHGSQTRIDNIECDGEPTAGGQKKVGVFLDNNAAGVTRCVIRKCAGGVIIQGGSHEMTDSLITQCTASNGGGLYAASCDLTIRNTAITECRAYGFGGGVFVESSTVNLSDNVSISRNHADSSGGGLWAEVNSPDFLSTIEIHDAEFFENGAAEFGGAIGTAVWAYASGSKMLLRLDDCTLRLNTAADRGGAVYTDRRCRLEMNYALVENNRTTSSVVGTEGGGGLHLRDSFDSYIANSTIQNNQSASQGGAAYITNTVSIPSVVRFHNCLIVGNMAAESAGIAAKAQEHLYIDLCTIARNMAVGGGGQTPGGHGVSLLDVAECLISNTIIWGNNALPPAAGLEPDQIFAPPPTVLQKTWVNVAGSSSAQDPFFAVGPTGTYLQPNRSYFLGFDPVTSLPSACVDGGNPNSTGILLAPPLGTSATTQVNLAADTGPLDIGFHYNGADLPTFKAFLESSLIGDTITCPNSSNLNLSLRASTSTATRAVLWVGSATGVSPGFFADGIYIPAAFDSYSLQLLNPQFGQLIFLGGIGPHILPQSGQSTQTLLSGSFACAGTAPGTFHLYHCAVVLEQQPDTSFRVVEVSNPHRLTIIR